MRFETTYPQSQATKATPTIRSRPTVSIISTKRDDESSISNSSNYSMTRGVAAFSRRSMRESSATSLATANAKSVSPSQQRPRRKGPASPSIQCSSSCSTMYCLVLVAVLCLASTLTEMGYGRSLRLLDVGVVSFTATTTSTDTKKSSLSTNKAAQQQPQTTAAANQGQRQVDAPLNELPSNPQTTRKVQESAVVGESSQINNDIDPSSAVNDESSIPDLSSAESTLPKVEETAAAKVSAAAAPANKQQTYVTHGKGQAVGTINNSAYFTLLADPRSGADMVMAGLNRHDQICASGGYPTAALLDFTMPWLADDSAEKGCTLAFVRESLDNILQDDVVNPKPATADERAASNWTPFRCAANYDRTHDPLKAHLSRFCTFIQRLQGDFSHDAMTKVFMDAFVTGDQNLMACSCPTGTTKKGLKVMADWLEKLPALNTTVAVGAKIIRLTRLNLFERYMSFVTTSVSQVWTVNSVQDKEARMKAFRTKHQEANSGQDYVVDIDWILFQFELMQATDRVVNEWAAQNGGDTLWVDYQHVRDNPPEAFAEMASFLGLEGGDATHESVFSRLLQNGNQDSTTGSFAAYNGQALLDYIGNRNALVEAFGAYGYNAFIGVSTYQPVQHVIYTPDPTLHTTKHARKGLDVTIVVAAQDRSIATGPSAKFRAVLSSIQAMPSDSIVVLSEGYSGTVNHHIKSLTAFYAELAKLRTLVAEMNRDHPGGAVLVSASNDCCSDAMAHVEPGALFDAAGQKRAQRTCSGEACKVLNGDNNDSKGWKKLMVDRAAKLSKSDSMYLDGSFVVGTARDMVAFINAIDIDPAEDDRAVLTDYVLQNPDKIVLDYDHKVFGERFDGVQSKMGGCDAVTTTTDSFETSTSPLFLHAARRTDCPVHYRHPNGKRYPMWEDAGIDIKPILGHIDQLFVHNVSLANIDPHFGSEIMYIMDATGVWGTEVRRDKYRVLPTEAFLVKAHSELMELAKAPPNSAESHRWSALQRTIQTTGFPYWGWYGDWKFCNSQNMGTESVPLFTTCATTSCPLSFPTPSYMNIIDSQPDPGNWYKVYGRFAKDYAWENKIAKVVWRGALSENDPTKVFESQRWRLTTKVTAMTDPKEKEMFDVGFTNIPIFLTAQIDIDASLAGGIVSGIGLMNDFQKYKAVLDMDGNSWSSRFGTMLCYNSVALKVEPAYADFWFYDLVPWKHYIPIKNDLSDLVENVQFALDPLNEPVIKEIIDSANQWCSERFIHKSLAHDMLDIWESYIQMLDRADPNWTAAWSKKKDELFAPSSHVKLVELK